MLEDLVWILSTPVINAIALITSPFKKNVDLLSYIHTMDPLLCHKRTGCGVSHKHTKTYKNVHNFTLQNTLKILYTVLEVIIIGYQYT
jgi:hypothetical protein